MWHGIVGIKTNDFQFRVQILQALVGVAHADVAGQMTLGDVQAFIQYSRMFTQPITQLASMTNLLQSLQLPVWALAILIGVIVIAVSAPLSASAR